MRILLIAYEFPPSASPQSLRWAYLSRELSLLGHEIDVLTIDLGGATPGLPTLPDSVRIHRTFAGPVRGLVAYRRNWRQRIRMQTQTASSEGEPNSGFVRPGWKLLLSQHLQKLAEYACFPDLRGEWRLWGRRALMPLLQQLQPDVVISSHEPATTLELGLLARQAGFAWIVDLADPVLAPYTLPRWRNRALALERNVCAFSDHVLVTAGSAQQLLRERHGPGAPVTVLTQGFDDRAPHREEPSSDGTFDPDRLELLYTGSFYSFRRPEALIAAVLRHPTARLTIASIVAPESINEASRMYPDSIRLLGFLPHARTLQLQRSADILVSIANEDKAQVPGKLYEYLGASRPILHLLDGAADAPAQIIAHRRRGRGCANDTDAISVEIGRLATAKQQQRLDADFDLDLMPVAEFGWSLIALHLERILLEARAKNLGPEELRARFSC